jgi:cellulose biosynthesis protein BcsQ
MLEWLNTVGIDIKGLITGLITAIVGAIVGALVKWLLDRREMEALRRESADLRTTLGSLDCTLEKTHARLAEQESANAAKQRELDRLSELLESKGVDIREREDRLTKLLGTLRDSEVSLWAKFDRVVPYSDYDVRIGRNKPIIITIANLKGGVGKTTLTGNLLAYFDKLGLKVLAIDLDYQGSLTTMLRSFGDPKARVSSVNELFAPGAGLGHLYKATRPLGKDLPRSRLASAFYEFARYEEYLMVEWLLQLGGDDVRYRLANLLLQDDVRNEFDVILIDVAPRITTGTVNALCASTHVLVPTIFNPLSAEPVENFLGMAKGLMDRLNPKLVFMGIVETLSPPDNQGQDARAAGQRIITEALQRSFPGIHILKSKVPRRPNIVEVKGGGLAALNGDRVSKGVFNKLGQEIREMTGL